MTYNGLEITGKIREVYPSTLVEQTSEPQLASPKQVWLTRVAISRDRVPSTYIELFGRFGQEYRGRAIKLILSYDKPKARLRRFRQEVFIDGRSEKRQTVIKRI